MPLTKLNFSGQPSPIGGLTYNGGTTLGALRIQTGTATTPSSSTDAGYNAYTVSTITAMEIGG